LIGRGEISCGCLLHIYYCWAQVWSFVVLVVIKETKLIIDHNKFYQIFHRKRQAAGGKGFFQLYLYLKGKKLRGKQTLTKTVNFNCKSNKLTVFHQKNVNFHRKTQKLTVFYLTFSGFLAKLLL
jgi:hypothetical protein